MKNIMFVCTGNICRSAMAEGILKDKLKKAKKDEEIYVCSAGIYAYTGDKATDNAILAVRDMGIDISSHRATNVRNSNIENMDIILCMTTGHRNELIYMYPDLKDKICTLKEYVGAKKDVNINDPWGTDTETYKNCAEEIKDVIDKIKI